MNRFKGSPLHDKDRILEIIDNLDVSQMCDLVTFLNKITDYNNEIDKASDRIDNGDFMTQGEVDKKLEDI